MICPNFNNPKVKEQFTELKHALGESNAYKAWELNNGYALDYNKDGNLSEEFTKLLDSGLSRHNAIKERFKILQNEDNSFTDPNELLKKGQIVDYVDFLWDFFKDKSDKEKTKLITDILSKNVKLGKYFKDFFNSKENTEIDPQDTAETAALEKFISILRKGIDFESFAKGLLAKNYRTLLTEEEPNYGEDLKNNYSIFKGVNKGPKKKRKNITFKKASEQVQASYRDYFQKDDESDNLGVDLIENFVQTYRNFEDIDNHIHGKKQKLSLLDRLYNAAEKLEEYLEIPKYVEIQENLEQLGLSIEDWLNTLSDEEYLRISHPEIFEEGFELSENPEEYEPIVEQQDNTQELTVTEVQNKEIVHIGNVLSANRERVIGEKKVIKNEKRNELIAKNKEYRKTVLLAKQRENFENDKTFSKSDRSRVAKGLALTITSLFQHVIDRDSVGIDFIEANPLTFTEENIQKIAELYTDRKNGFRNALKLIGAKNVVDMCIEYIQNSISPLADTESATNAINSLSKYKALYINEANTLIREITGTEFVFNYDENLKENVEINKVEREQTDSEINEVDNDDINNTEELEDGSEYLKVDQKQVKFLSNIDNIVKNKLSQISKVYPLYPDQLIVNECGFNEYYDYSEVINALTNLCANTDCSSEQKFEKVLKDSEIAFKEEILNLMQDRKFRTLLWNNCYKSVNNYSKTYTTKEGKIARYDFKEESYSAMKKKLQSLATLKSLKAPFVFVYDNLDVSSEIKTNILLVDKIKERLSFWFNEHLVDNKIKTYESSEHFLQEVLSGTEAFLESLQELGITDITRDNVETLICRSIDKDGNFTNQNVKLLCGKIKLILDYLTQSKDSPLSNNKLLQTYNSLSKGFDGIRLTSKEATILSNKKQFPIFSPLNFLDKVTQLITKSNDADFEEFINQYRNSTFHNCLFKEHDSLNLYSWLTDLSIDHSNQRSNFKFNKFLSHNGVEYTKMTKAQFIEAALSNYFLAKGDFVNYILPVLADKSTNGTITWRKYSVGKINDEYAQDGIIPRLFTVFYQELNRMRNAYNRAINNQQFRVKNYDVAYDFDTKTIEVGKNAMRFYFLPSFNKYLDAINDKSKAEGNQIATFIRNFVRGEIDNTLLFDIRNLVQDEIDNYLTNEFNIWINDLKEQLLYYSLQQKFILNNFDQALKHFYFNSYYANTQMYQMFTDDLCFYKNADDIQKRIAQWITPGIPLSTNAEFVDDNSSETNSIPNTTRVIVLEDFKNASPQLDNINLVRDIKIKKLIDLAKKSGKYNETQLAHIISNIQKDIIKQFEGYGKIDMTDGQGFMSLEQIKKMYIALGRSEQILPIYNALKNILKETNRDKRKQLIDEFNASHIADSIETAKQFTFTTISENNGINELNILRPFQVKNAEYALLDYATMLTSGDETLFNLAKAMDDFNIDCAFFESNIKVGLPYKTIKTKGLTTEQFTEQLRNNLSQEERNYIIEHNTTDKELTQETPKHYENNSADLGTQVIKLINGCVHSAAKRNTFEALIDKKMRLNIENLLYNRLGMDSEIVSKLKTSEILNTEERLKLNYNLSRLINDNLASSGKNSADSAYQFALDENMEFNLPLSEVTSFKRINKLFINLIKKTVLSKSLPGGQLVQVTSAFELNKMQNKAEYDKSGVLRIMYKDADGTITATPKNPIGVAYLEAEAPLYYKEFYEMFMKDGVIDYERIEKEHPELLNLVAYRIPTEGYCSMFPIKIVKFSNKISGGNIKLPVDINTIAGIDFDIDKLFFVAPSVEFEKIGNKIVGVNVPFGINKLTSQLNEIETNNQILQYLYDVLTSEEAFVYMFSPSNFDHLKELSDTITIYKKLLSEKPDNQNLTDDERLKLFRSVENMSDKERKHQLDELNQRMNINDFKTISYIHNRNSISAQLIGVAANVSSLHVFMKHAGITVSGLPECIINGNKIANLFQPFSQEYANDGYTLISENLREFLAAAVDGIKSPVLNGLNLNMLTVNLGLPLVLLGFDLKTVSLILQQPVISRLIFAYNNAVDKAAEKGRNERVDISEVIRTVRKSLGIDEAINFQNPIEEKDLVVNIGKNIKNMTKQELNNQAHILVLAENIFNLSNAHRLGNTLLKIDNKGNASYQNVFGMLRMFNNFDRVLDNITHAYGNDNTFYGSKFVKFVENSDIISKTRKYLEDLFNTLFNYVNPEISYFYNNVLKANLFNKTSVQFTPKDIMDAYYDWKTYQFLNNSVSINTKALDSRNEVGYLDPSVKAINYYTIKFPTEAFALRNSLMRQERFKDNYFLKYLELHNYNSGIALVADTVGMENDLLQKIRTDCESLYFSGIEGVKEYITDLFVYSIYRNGFNTNNKSLLQLFPTSVKKDLNGYISFNNQYVSNFVNTEQINNFCELFLRHHPDLVITDDGKLSNDMKAKNTYTKSEDSADEIIDIKNNKKLSVLGKFGVSKVYSNEVVGKNLKNQSQEADENDIEYVFTTDDIEELKETEIKQPVVNYSYYSYMTEKVKKEMEDQKENIEKAQENFC